MFFRPITLYNPLGEARVKVYVMCGGNKREIKWQKLVTERAGGLFRE
jgi:hypothetical protein